MEAQQYYNFPYVPYPIQVDFMNHLYRVMDEGGVTLLQSPTGTGKTLSIICGSLKWLIKHNNEAKSNIDKYYHSLNCSQPLITNNDPDWLKSQINQKYNEKHNENINMLKQLFEDLSYHEKLIKGYPKNELTRHSNCQTTLFNCNEENNKNTSSVYENIRVHQDSYYIQIKKHFIKIFYCSRTHSQLDQFVSQFKNTTYAASTRLVCLGSRQLLCINSSVNKFKNSQMINEKCLEARDKKKCECISKGCQSLTDTILSNVCDIEELYGKGKEFNLCPYYASRNASILAHITVLPYQYIFNKDTREALNIDLTNNVLIIDEAHNLISCIESCNSAKLNYNEMQTIFSSLEYYKKSIDITNIEYHLYLDQLTLFLRSFVDYSNSRNCSTSVDFLTFYNLQDINTTKLCDYISTSRLTQKLYHSYYKIKTDETIPSCISTFFSMISCIKYSTSNDRIISSGDCNIESRWIKFICLDIQLKFKEVVSACKAVAIVGGTLEPISDFIHLVKQCGFNENKIQSASFDHIVSAGNILSVVIEKSPTNVKLKWCYENYNDREMVIGICRSITNLTKLIPDGVVCFFPSYKMLETFLGVLKETGDYDTINSCKKIFNESKTINSNEILDKFSKRIAAKLGAVLFAVMNGKLSEGINFSDELCRGICIVGMPYGNPKDVELSCKLDFIKKTLGETERQQYYHNLCMRTVNQAIGRAIRHINDYSAIIFLDFRYSDPHIHQKLPAWISKATQSCDSFPKSIPLLKQFFKNR